MKKWLNTYFDFSKREFNGLIALVILVLLVSLIPYMYSLFIPTLKNDANVPLAINKLLPANANPTASADKRLEHRKNNHKHSLFPFDPNTINVIDWQKLGLSEKQAKSILKYIAKGGEFKNKEDLKKMYTINSETYARLVPYIEIDATKTEKPIEYKKGYTPGYKRDFSLIRKQTDQKSILSITELNGADSAALDDIKGIGPTFAKRIIKYRDRLGGFYKKEQLLEVFGLDSVTYSEIKQQIIVDADKLNKININTAKLEDFRNHPYIRYKQVNALIEYRKQHGNYSNIAELNRVAVLDDETVIRLSPYLTF